MGRRQLLRLSDDLEMATLATDRTGSKSTLSVHVQSICKPVTLACNRWRAPPEGTTKLNSDAAFLHEADDSGRSSCSGFQWQSSSVCRLLVTTVYVDRRSRSLCGSDGFVWAKEIFHGAYTNWDKLCHHWTRASIGRSVQIVVVCCDDRY